MANCKDMLKKELEDLDGVSAVNSKKALKEAWHEVADIDKEVPVANCKNVLEEEVEDGPDMNSKKMLK